MQHGSPVSTLGNDIEQWGAAGNLLAPRLITILDRVDRSLLRAFRRFGRLVLLNGKRNFRITGSDFQIPAA